MHVSKGKIEEFIKKSLEDYAFPLYFLIYTIYKFIKGKQIFNYYIRTWKVKPLHILRLADYKTSDTLFILGSGSSINQLKPREWNLIKKCDSIGFNFWVIHDFIPTFYTFEPPRSKINEDILYKILSLKTNNYRNVPIFLRGSESRIVDLSKIPKKLFGNLYVSINLMIPGSDSSNLQKTLTYLKKMRLFAQKNRIDLVSFKRASLSWLVAFGLLSGYRNIVLCGVDLNTTKYFYEQQPEYYKKNGIPIPNTMQPGQIHRTIDPSIGHITIDKVLYAINDTLLKPRRVKLFVALKSSALYPKLPCYFR